MQLHPVQAAQQELAKQCPGVPTIYDTVDLHFLREARDIITTQDSQPQQVRVAESRVFCWQVGEGCPSDFLLGLTVEAELAHFALA